jgi:hypothetical protein
METLVDSQRRWEKINSVGLIFFFPFICEWIGYGGEKKISSHV